MEESSYCLVDWTLIIKILSSAVLLVSVSQCYYYRVTATVTVAIATTVIDTTTIALILN